MKLADLVFGFVIFSLLVTLIFTAVYNMTSLHSADSADEYDALVGEYNYIDEFGLESNSTLRAMDEQMKLGTAEGETTDITFISGTISAGRLIRNIFTTTGHVIEEAYVDTSSYIPRIIIDAILAIIGVFLMLVVLHFIRGYRTEV